MSNIIEITDIAAPQLDVYARLTQAQLKNKKDPTSGLFIAESATVVGHALDAGYEPVSLLMERRHIDGPAKELIARCGNVPVYTADRDVLAGLTGYELTRGILCAMRRPVPVRAEDICPSARRIAVLEGIVDATNVGAIFRSAAALGMDAVLLSPTCCDPLHRRAVRVSMGTVFQIPWARLCDDGSSWPQAGFDLLRSMGFQTAAMALTDNSISIRDPRLQQVDKLAVLLGTEGSGLSPSAISGSDYVVRIPMSHGVDSLNVAAASAVVFWQLQIP